MRNMVRGGVEGRGEEEGCKEKEKTVATLSQVKCLLLMKFYKHKASFLWTNVYEYTKHLKVIKQDIKYSIFFLLAS